MKTSTYFGLLSEFGTAQIPLEKICETYLGIDLTNAKRKAAKQQLPVPTFKLRPGGHTKYFIKAEHLAEIIDENAQKAQEDWQAANG